MGVTLKNATLAILGVLGLLLAFAQPAQASFGDCADPAYRARFDREIENVPYDCVERLRVSVSTEEGSRQIRLLHDRGAAGLVAAPGAIEAFERGIRGAAEALAQIGPFRMDDVTVLLIDGLPPAGRDGDVISNIAALTEASGGECRVGAYLLSAGGGVENAAYVIAHELFHCVQDATLTPEQIATSRAGTGAGGDWWLEGSADWFAALSVPDPGPVRDRIAEFDRQSPNTPLYRMAYSAVVFFLWLNDAHGPASILPFLHAMADRSGAAAQQAAMRRALEEDEWLAFARAYVDRRIKHPHGTALSVNPAEGDRLSFTEGGRQSIRLEPFVIHRGWIDFACGQWGTEVQPDRSFTARTEGGEDWGALPDPVDTREDGETRFRFVGLAATGESVTTNIRVERQATCQPCREISEIDQCLVGTWQQSGGGPVEWMRRVMPPGFRIPRHEREGGLMVLGADGSYSTTPIDVQATITAGEGRNALRMEGQGTAQATGRWSAKDGKLNICQDSGGFRGQAQVRGRRMSLPNPGSSGETQLDYTCSAGALETKLSFPGIPEPMVTQYSKVGTTAPTED